ncbi:Sodium-dependent nutrient amino acid transporter 1 [Orchesella cincta]|uniref:Sodium-dependent nutrient amino acid transporter 1 n=1 Tax=Orchesella cincta TaxID=48709 RepID=A0A1D2MKT3_ORCCI|nr:Sodium-dependent nutrient amino acid transporter 1 [Orchesella cincta]
MLNCGSISVSEDNVPVPKSSTSTAPNLELGVPNDQQELVRERPEWNNQTEFFFSCISVCVGLGNVWRFPITAYTNGGGAFVIVYMVVAMLIGRFIYFLELFVGQFSSNSQIGIWKMVPFFKGVGIVSLISMSSIVIYYVYIMALVLHYLFASILYEKLPWTEYNENWMNYNNNTNGGLNISIPEMYFQYEVVKEINTAEINGLGYPDCKLALYLGISWMMIAGSVRNGVKSSGKVAYFTAIIPYIVMGVFTIRGVILEGGWDGVVYFITPHWNKILEPKIWFEAVIQSFFSLNNGCGANIMFGSHNPFHHDLFKTSIIITLVDTSTSLLAGFTIFTTLGNLAAERGMDVSQVVGEGGPGLVFITYADAIAKFGWFPQLFSVLLFFMLFMLGLGTANSCVGSIVTVLSDSFPNCKWKVLLGCVGVGGFTIGLAYTTPRGLWLMELVSFYSLSFVIFTTTILFLIGVTWVYGVEMLLDDIQFMLGTRPGVIFKICVKFIIPSVMCTILGFMLVSGMTPTYQGLEYPFIALAFGWTITAVTLLILPIAAIHSVMQMSGCSLRKKLIKSFAPTTSWGPRNPEIKRKWIEFTNIRK